MIERTMRVNAFLETRPAALFVQTASRYSSKIQLSIAGKTVNAKSIMGIIALGIEDGQRVTVSADGEDELSAVTALEQFFRAEETA